MKIERISWDQETVDHISNHSVSPEEVEQVLFDDVDSPLIMRGKQDRYLAYGKTNGGRLLFIVWVARHKKTKIIGNVQKLRHQCISTDWIWILK